MTEEIIKKKRKFLFNPLRRPLPYIGLLLAILLTIFQQTIRNYVADTIGDVLVNSMRDGTSGVYKTTYDLVRFDIIAKELRISNLKIELDTNVISKENYLLSRPNLIKVNTPLIVVKLNSILPLLLNKQLYISYIGAKQPQFSVTKSLHNTVKEDSTKSRENTLIASVKTYFSAFEIDSFRIEKGAFNILTHDNNEKETSVIKIGEFTTMLKNFRLDSLSPSILLKGIRARSFELEVIDQEVNLPDLNQNIYFNKLQLSTTDSTFLVDSLTIRTIERNTGKSNVDYSIRKLEILGFNFEKAFFDNQINVSKIQVIEPKIKYKQLEFSTIQNSKTSNKTGIFNYFKELNVDNMQVLNGSLQYEARHNSYVDNFSLSINNYRINPDDLKNEKVISDLKIANFNASGISQELPDSIHLAKIKSIIYNGNKNNLRLNNLSINPIKGRKSYKFLQSRNVNFSHYSSIKSLELTTFIPEDLILKNLFEVDSIIITKPVSSIVQYPAMFISKKKQTKKNNFKFEFNHLITKNGSLKLRAYQNKTNQTTSLSGINLITSNINERTSINHLPAYFNLQVSNGSAQLKNIGHTLDFKRVQIDQTQSLFLEQATLKPDSTTLPYNHINAFTENILIKGLNLKELQADSLQIDSVLIGNLALNNNLTRAPFAKPAKKNKSKLEHILIGKFRIQSANLQSTQSGSNISVQGAKISIDSLRLDSLKSTSEPIVTFQNTLLGADLVNFNSTKNEFKIKGRNISYIENDSSLFFNNVQFTSADKSANIGVSELRIAGFDKEKLQFKKGLDISKLEIIAPNIILNPIAKNDTVISVLNLQKHILSKELNKINLDTLLIVNGSSSVNLKSDHKLDLRSFKGIATKIKLDTNSTILSSINDFNGVFEFNDIYLRGLTDTLNITKLHFNADQSFVWTDSIHFATALKKNYLNVRSPGVAIDHINIPSLLENRIDISRISTRNNFILLTETDTTKSSTNELKKQLKLPLEIDIEDINVLNTTFDYNKIAEPNHLLANLNFDIELDSLLIPKEQKIDLSTQTTDSRLRTYNFSFNLPDSLNTLGFDTLLVSSGDAEINMSNLALTARYPKYEYGNQVGHQVDWKDLLIDHIKIERIDFEELLDNNSVKSNKITIKKGHLKLFKDKQLPFPAGRVVPILQERVMNAKVPIAIDTIEIKNFDIYQSTLQSTGLQEGGINFMNTEGLITNITNDSLRLKNNKMLNVVASTQIMGSGNLYAEMDFDMLDPNNLFFFDARLGKMDAKAFNNILEAAAQVSVKSGEIKSLNLQATGNKKYAYGDMSFIYNNLKVETINKKTLENKGMGKVIKTFFANAFVVKKNNSRIKFISRRGGMYYERDISRITLDYMAKTAISGLVSSIGAKSNAKQIKQIAKDNKAARDLELKLEKERKKAAKKEAKRSK